MIKRFIFILVSTLLMACGNKTTYPKLETKLKIELERLDLDLFNCSQPIKPNEIDSLNKIYGSFFSYYNNGVLLIGDSHLETYPTVLNSFINYPAVQLAKKKVDSVYSSISDLEDNLSSALSYYHYYFPDKLIPRCVSYIGGFNHSIVLTDSVIGIGLDKYLGDITIYSQLGTPKYLSYNMRKERITTDILSNWIKSEWPYDYNQDNTVMSKMIYEGKILYMVQQMQVNLPDSTLFGFSQTKLDWCQANEKNMWKLLIEEKLLYSNQRFDLTKLTEDAPYTSIFPIESPGKACNWIGYQIVRKYMSENKTIQLHQLITDQNNNQLLEKAKYNPK